MFISQPTFVTLELKVNESTEYVDFVPKIAIEFNNTPLAIEQSNYVKIVNAYIVYDLDNWPKVPLRNFTLKNCLFCATVITKKVIKKSGCILVVK